MDLKLIIELVGFIGMIAMTIIIKFNDLKHLADGMRDIKKDIKCHYDKLEQHGERISRIEGKLNGKS